MRREKGRAANLTARNDKLNLEFAQSSVILLLVVDCHLIVAKHDAVLSLLGALLCIHAAKCSVLLKLTGLVNAVKIVAVRIRIGILRVEFRLVRIFVLLIAVILRLFTFIFIFTI